ncbi:MAG: BolA family transcriptional regulator [Alphaproteobacteria bacterium]|nr:BolA family transcriptional regulator [Alphaproteobacteria bacterium]
MNSVQEELEDRIQKHLLPSFLDIKNESEMHRGHMNGPKDKNAESHFRVKIISKAFTGLSKLERHRLVHGILDDLLKNHIHALSLTLLDDDQE